MSLLLADLRHADRIDWSRASVDANGDPLAIDRTAADVAEASRLSPLVASPPRVAGKLGRPALRLGT